MYTARAREILSQLNDVLTLTAAEDIETLRYSKRGFDFSDLAKVTGVDEQIWGNLYREGRFCMEYPLKETPPTEDGLEHIRPVAGQVYDQTRRAYFHRELSQRQEPEWGAPRIGPFIERLVGSMPKSGIYQPH